MTRETFVKTSQIDVSAEELFSWHLGEGVFERLSPPWDPPADTKMRGTIEDGGIRTFSVGVGPFRYRWTARHSDFQPGRSFVDTQESGPFRFWRHTHRVIPESEDRSLLEDEIEYELPLGKIGRVMGSEMLRRKLEAVFRYRHHVTRNDLMFHQRVMKGRKMRILVSGSGGLVGKQLTAFLKSGGHDVVRLRRGSSGDGEHDVIWDPILKKCEESRFEGFDAVVHLAGENIAGGRWTERRKAEIRRSRVEDTKFLSGILTGLQRPPKQLICASAIGYYGPRGDEPLTENAEGGAGFLSEVCREWEASAEAARTGGIGVSHPRFGIILSPEGGALGKMLFPFKMGVGGVLGSGRQWMSWIALDDVVGAISHLLAHPELTGPINVTAPHPVTNAEFTKILGKVLGRPTIFPMPGFAARLAFGEMADELLLTGSRVIPKHLTESGYEFQFADLETALCHLLGK